jgi:hypothetical protein
MVPVSKFGYLWVVYIFVAYTESENENILQVELQIVGFEFLTAVAMNRYNAMQSGGNQSMFRRNN